MFFRKDILNPKPSSLEPETFIAEDEVTNLPSDLRHVYVIGDNALTCWLAAKLTDAGHNVIIIAGKENNLSLSTNGITLKEDNSLKKSKYKFTTSFWIKETPKLVVITADAGHINASLAAVSKDKIGTAPVLCFTLLKNTDYLEAVIGGNFCQGFFDGYLQLEEQQLFVHGRTPQIKICKNIDWQKSNPFLSVFSYTNLPVSYETDVNAAFWEHFAPFAAASLLSAFHNKTIFEITKDKQLRECLPQLLSETVQIAAIEQVKLDEERLLKKIYNTPMNYRYPLQNEINSSRFGETNLISSVLINTARKGKFRFRDTQLNHILKQLYNLILV